MPPSTCSQRLGERNYKVKNFCIGILPHRALEPQQELGLRKLWKWLTPTLRKRVNLPVGSGHSHPRPAGFRFSLAQMTFCWQNPTWLLMLLEPNKYIPHQPSLILVAHSFSPVLVYYSPPTFTTCRGISASAPVAPSHPPSALTWGCRGVSLTYSLFSLWL